MYQVKVSFVRHDTTDHFDTKEKTAKFVEEQLALPEVERCSVKKVDVSDGVFTERSRIEFTESPTRDLNVG